MTVHAAKHTQILIPAGAARPWLIVAGVGLLAVPLAWLVFRWAGLGGSAELASPDARFLVQLLLVSPLVEEIVLRLGLQAYLLKRQHTWRHFPNVPFDLFIPALMFVALHATRHSGLFLYLYLIPGVVLGWVYRETRNVTPVIGLHAWFNLLVVVMCARG